LTTSTAGFWCEATNTATRPDVLDDMLTFNSENGRPQVWMIVLENDSQGAWGEGPSVFLKAALAGDHGYVSWTDRSGEYVLDPEDRRVFTTEEPVSYYDPHGVEGAPPVRHHVDAITVAAAVSQALRTRRRPTVVAWVPRSAVAASA
jgi:immunity protein Imm1 of predicted polymorphic toxin system